MKNIKVLLFPIAAIFVFAAALFLGNSLANHVKAKTRVETQPSWGSVCAVQIGKQYQYNVHWNPKNPFLLEKIDTITILDQKNGYTLIHFDIVDGFEYSMETEFLLQCIKELE